MLETIIEQFYHQFNRDPEVCSSAPGRINLIGEHTDYNQGFVLPAAIDKRIAAAFRKRNDGSVCMYSVDFAEMKVKHLNAISPETDQIWVNYITGVVNVLMDSGFPVKGFDIVIGGNIPIGAGLSSSAAMECAVISGLNELFNFGIGKLELVRMAQLAEHTYAGVKCGIMDQFASVFGKKNQVIRLDCKSLAYTYKPFELSGVGLLLFDTKVKHALANSAYNIRRTECEQGVALIAVHEQEVSCLRDVTISQLDQWVKPIDLKVYNRCRYVIEENQRLLAACNDLDEKNFSSFGQRMFETHEGLRNLYEVSCPELDYLVDLVKGQPDVLGARMLGGGFGGCTINLIVADSMTQVKDHISQKFVSRFGHAPAAYEVNITDGAFATHISNLTT